MKLKDIVQEQGIKISEGPKKSEHTTHRRHFWDEEEKPVPPPETEKQPVSRDSLEKKQRKSREYRKEPRISREYRVPRLESIESLSRDSLERSIVDLNCVVGLQRRVLLIIFTLLESNGSRVSPPIAISLIAERASTSIANTQNAIKELIKKSSLIRKQFQRGRGGWTIYEMDEHVFSKLSTEKTRESLEILQRFSRVQMGNKSRETAPSSSSKILDLNKTTTENTDDHVNFSQTLPTDPSWDKIDHDSLKEIGFNASHVAQIQQQGIHSPKTLQDSIYAFYYDLNANSKAKEISGPALNYFMGILRRGPYSPPANYESPEDQQLREYLEAKEKLLEGRREKLERLKTLEFEEWADSLSREQVEKLAPMGSSDTLKRSQLRNHFDEKVWEEKKIKIVNELGVESDPHILRNIENTSYDRGTIPPLHPPSTRV